MAANRPITQNMAMTPRIEAIRRLIEMLAPTAVAAVVDGVVVAVVVVVGVVDIFYQRRGYIPRWLLPGML